LKKKDTLKEWLPEAVEITIENVSEAFFIPLYVTYHVAPAGKPVSLKAVLHFVLNAPNDTETVEPAAAVPLL
jgi:hypothetical protein